MHMNRKKYTIGTVSFEAVFPDIYEDKNPYSLFLDNDAKADVMYHYQYVENLPQKQGVLVDKQDFQETYKDQEDVYRYLYQKGKHLPYACTCLKKAGETVNVYLTKEAPRIWGGLVFQTIAKITSKFFLIFHKKKLVYSITYYRQAFLLMKSFH